MEDQIKMTGDIKEFLESNMIGRSIGNFLVKRILGSGNTAVTFEVEDTGGLPWALKVVLRESYGDRAPFKEVGRFSQARDVRFLVFPQEVGEWALDAVSGTCQFVWFKSRCVNGQSLRNYLDSQDDLLSEKEVLLFIEHMTAALEEMKYLGFHHGDLHDGNIMRETLGAGGVCPETRYVMIDFSEAYPVQDSQKGLSPDMENFSKHLRRFYDAFCRKDSLTREDERTLFALSHIPGLANGATSQIAGLFAPRDILERFTSNLKLDNHNHKTLTDPFHPLSAENISDESLLADLCYTNIWWRKELETNENLLLIGPRGCGKTMIFRRLRFKTKVIADKTEEVQNDDYIGFYVPCESIFYMRYSDLSAIDIDTNAAALVLYFNMAVLSEIASTFAVFPQDIGIITPSLVSDIESIVREEVGALWVELNLPVTVTSLREFSLMAEAIMRHIRKSIAFRKPVAANGTLDFITRVVTVIKDKLPSIVGRCFIFFLDDYTEERVPLRLQEALHPIVCQRSPDMAFKLSAHMFGSIYHNPRPLALDEGRNIQVINLGTAYLNRKKRRTEGKILVNILNERFKRSPGYKGTVDEWLGRTSYPGGSTLSQALHDANRRPKVRYHGTQCLMDLCSGDYSEMIRLVGEIFREAGIAPHDPVRLIEPSLQSRVIERISREYLARIRYIRPDGQKLFSFVNSFGELSKNLLYEHELVGQGTDTKGNPRKDPYDMLNIYVDELMSASPSARNVWERLQKASIFIDAGVATSRRLAIADQATLRRIYCPAFRTTLTSSEHLMPTKSQFEWLMDSPEEFCRDYYRRNTSISKDQASFWSERTADIVSQPEPSPAATSLPDDKDKRDYGKALPPDWEEFVRTLPQLRPASSVPATQLESDIFIGAIGFEERTAEGAKLLATKGVRVSNAVLFEFDRYYGETEKRRPEYEKAVLEMTSGKSYRPMNAPVGAPDPIFLERLTSILTTLTSSSVPSVIFDTTSCPSLILSQTLNVLLNTDCNLTLVYSEAEEYFPTREEWESGHVLAYGGRVQGPFAGIRFVAKPAALQSDDVADLPVLLVLFPTFNTERTDGVIAELDPVLRVWLFGEPHDLAANQYRIEMEKSFASPIMYPGDQWSLVTTFDYRDTLRVLSTIYGTHRPNYRLVIMPHGSKMQTLGVALFASSHEVSQVFAMPRTYEAGRYSKGCAEVWSIPLGNTRELVDRLRRHRVIVAPPRGFGFTI